MARGIVSLVLKLFLIMFLSVYSALQNPHFANIWYERMCFILCLGVLVMLCLSLFLADSFDFGQNDMQFSWASIHSVQRKRHVVFKFKKNNMSSIWVSFQKKKNPKTKTNNDIQFPLLYLVCEVGFWAHALCAYNCSAILLC